MLPLRTPGPTCPAESQRRRRNRARVPWRESVRNRRVARKLLFRRAREWSIRDRAVQPYKPDHRAPRGVVRPMAQAEKAGDRSVSERRHLPYRDRTVRPVVRQSFHRVYAAWPTIKPERGARSRDSYPSLKSVLAAALPAEMTLPPAVLESVPEFFLNFL